MRQSGFYLAIVCGTCLSLSSAAHAQGMPLGGRTASMGGAGVAAGRDGAMPYVNPAGYARVPSTTLSLSASLYRWEQLGIEPFFFHGTVDPALGDSVGDPSVERNELISSRFSSFPGAASALWHLGPDDAEAGTHHVLSASIVVSRNRDLAMEGDFALSFEDGTNWRETFTRTDLVTTYDFGPGYALKLGDFRLGLVAAFVYQTGGRTQSNSILTSTDEAFISQSSTSFDKFSTLGFQPVLGAQWTLVEGLSLGASLAAPSLHVLGSREGQGEGALATPPGVMDRSALDAYRFEGEHERNLPARIRAGLAYEVPKNWAIAADVAVTLPRERALFMDAETLTVTQQQGLPVEIMQVAEQTTYGVDGGTSLYAGVEKFVSSILAIRAGAFYEPSLERLAMDSGDVLALDVDHWGATVGLGLENDFGEVTFGLAFKHGSGRTVAGDAFTQVGSSAFPFVDVESNAVLAYIAGAVDVGELAEWAKIARDPGKLFETEQGHLRLTDLDPRLAVLAQHPELSSLAQRSSAYVVTGEPDYDRFFQRIARIRLSFAAAPVVVNQAAGDVQSAAREWSALPDAQQLLSQVWLFALSTPTDPLPASFARLPRVERVMRAVAALRAIELLVRSTGSDLAALASDGKRLVERAQHDFTGPGLVMLPAVLKNLAAAQSDVAAALQHAPELLVSLDRLLEVLTDLSTAEPPAPEPPAAPPLPSSLEPLPPMPAP